MHARERIRCRGAARWPGWPRGRAARRLRAPSWRSGVPERRSRPWRETAAVYPDHRSSPAGARLDLGRFAFRATAGVHRPRPRRPDRSGRMRSRVASGPRARCSTLGSSVRVGGARAGSAGPVCLGLPGSRSVGGRGLPFVRSMPRVRGRRLLRVAGSRARVGRRLRRQSRRLRGTSRERFRSAQGASVARPGESSRSSFSRRCVP